MSFTDLSTPEKIVVRTHLESLYGAKAVEFREWVMRQIREKPRPLHLDFSQTSYLDSLSIGGLLELYKTLKLMKCQIIIDDASESVRELFLNLTLDKIFVM